MVNPIVGAYDLFVGFCQALPAPIMYLVGLGFGLIILSTVVSMIFRG